MILIKIFSYLILIYSLYFFIFKYFNLKDFICAGEELVEIVGRLRFIQDLSELGQLTVPQFKFYTAIVLKILKHQKEYGAPIRQSLGFIRQELEIDLRFEKKLKAVISGHIFQILFLLLIIWSFVFISEFILQVTNINKLPILVFHIVGCLTYFLLSKIIYKKIFSPYEYLLYSGHHLISLLQIGISQNEVLQSLADEKFISLNKSKWSFVLKRWISLIEKLQMGKESLLQEAIDWVSEVIFIREQDFEKYLKIQKNLILVIITVFFLPSYLWYLYNLIQWGLLSHR